MLIRPLTLLLTFGLCLALHAAPADHVPAEAPRTWVPAGELQGFRAFIETPEGQQYYATIKRDFDAYWMDFAFPEEPGTYGDPDPKKRTADKVILWREAQDVSNQIATVAEAATMIWLVEGDTRYLDKAKSFLLQVCEWDPRGVTDIYYNDEAHFRLWRKLPEVFDQIRDELTPAEREKVIAAFRERGNRSVEWIKRSGIEQVKRNSVEHKPSSHPVRFMAMTGASGLALWDDIPEAKEWYAFAYDFYRDIFTPFGGDDGGWAEGTAYWRGVYEHAVFQDALLLIDDPLAYNQPFWQNTGYFQVYFTQPYFATGFGDLSNSGKFDIEPGVYHFVRHLSKVLQDGYLRAWTDLYDDPRPLPSEYDLKEIYRVYPNLTEYVWRDYAVAGRKLPAAKDLRELPSSRYFADVGWVAFHSALGQPDEDIHLSFKSSPYGSFSHSHGDQNAFILNAFGENLAINSGYREYHRSKHHKYYTRETRSKNALLIDMRGQDTQNLAAKGEITHYETGERYAWARGEAKQAYQILQPQIELEQVTRDIVFIDDRYFVVRDVVKADDPVMVSYLLHAEKPIANSDAVNAVHIVNGQVHLGVRLEAWQNDFEFNTWRGFDVAVDQDYVDPEEVAKRGWLTAPNVDQEHFRADTAEYSGDVVIYSLLWPTEKASDLADLTLKVVDRDTVEVQRPGGSTDRLQFGENEIHLK
ncbi:MAG: heparinase II/III family protein [Verrucomicrobiota bacterium JB022]|nr:heparinase II/III family protein [Verrucomicrobiota bacterium JB022]